MIPALFPPTVQIELLSRLFHRDLSCPEHQTNLHLYYDVTYPEDAEGTHMPKSFFGDDSTRILQPKDLEVHQPISVQGLLEKKLRWVTLGGQCDQTDNVYASGTPPEFPPDIANLIHAAFPDTTAQTAILNLCSAGDTLGVRRGVSDNSEEGLISVSFGCDGLFLASHDDGNGCEIIRLRSGDTVYMTGKSRFAWHGVPKILPSTCPKWLSDWPSSGNSVPSMPPGPYEMWKGWISSKRINLDVRQMNVHAPEG